MELLLVNQLLTEQREMSQLNLKPKNSIQRNLWYRIINTNDSLGSELPGLTYWFLFYFYWTLNKSAFLEQASFLRNSYCNHTLFSNCILEWGANLEKKWTIVMLETSNNAGCIAEPFGLHQSSVQCWLTASTGLRVDRVAIATKCHQILCEVIHRRLPASLVCENHEREPERHEY